MTLPTQMQALVRTTAAWQADRPSAALELVRRLLPVPGKGEVLLRMEAVGCNPSDLAALAGYYAVVPPPGGICGFEGCGRVIEANAGLLGNYLKGKRVATAAPGNGLWAGYSAVPANFCLPIADAVPMETAAAYVVNPMTAVVLAGMARRARAKAVVLSAAGSQLARGIHAILKRASIACILIVRRQEQVAELRAAGGAVVLNQTSADFEAALGEACARLQPMMFLDAAASRLTGQVTAALPEGAETIVYGALDESDGGYARASIPALIFRDARVRGFWLPTYLRDKSIIHTLRLAAMVRRLFADGVFATRVAGTSSLADFPVALDAYVADMSAGKRFAVMPA